MWRKRNREKWSVDGLGPPSLIKSAPLYYRSTSLQGKTIPCFAAVVLCIAIPASVLFARTRIRKRLPSWRRQNASSVPALFCRLLVWRAGIVQMSHYNFGAFSRQCGGTGRADTHSGRSLPLMAMPAHAPKPTSAFCRDQPPTCYGEKTPPKSRAEIEVLVDPPPCTRHAAGSLRFTNIGGKTWRAPSHHSSSRRCKGK
jgi:hypothetical protein